MDPTASKSKAMSWQNCRFLLAGLTCERRQREFSSRVTEVKQGLKGEDSCLYCDSWHSTPFTESLQQREEQEQVRFTTGIRVKTKPFMGSTDRAAGAKM